MGFELPGHLTNENTVELGFDVESVPTFVPTSGLDRPAMVRAIVDGWQSMTEAEQGYCLGIISNPSVNEADLTSCYSIVRRASGQPLFAAEVTGE